MQCRQGRWSAADTTSTFAKGESNMRNKDEETGLSSDELAQWRENSEAAVRSMPHANEPDAED